MATMAQAKNTKGAAPEKKAASSVKPKKAAATAKKAKPTATAKKAQPAAPAKEKAAVAAAKKTKPTPPVSRKTASAAPAKKTAAAKGGDAQASKRSKAEASVQTKKPAARSAASKAKGGVPKLPHLDSKTLKALITKLREMREESQHVVNLHVQADLKHREEGGEVGDDMDQASNERDREFSLLIHQRHLRRLKQIDDAFERIDGGSYGLCEGTEEPINPRRLLIMPLARFSLEYQQQQEKMLGRSPEDGMSGGDDSLISDE